ncbi:MAG: threonine ammonia-lyase [Methanoregulaceae archaeon]|nr:threonine ammonia-lyase [Methanoregulaceae archaeon]
MLTLPEIHRAADLLRKRIIRTPLVYSPTFSEMTGVKIFLKLETLQKAGSFKVRGAAYRILSDKTGIGEKGVIAASAGNHAQGVSVAAAMAGIPATIVMPLHASLSKLAATNSYGARVILHGENLTEAIGEAKRLAEESGAVFIHPFDDPGILAGTATIGLEILEDLPDCDVIVVPVGGGGLIAGIAAAAHLIRPGIRIIGIQAKACPSAFDALRAGEAVDVEPGPSIADGIMVSRVGSLTLPVIQSLVEEIVIVDEEEITDAMLLLLERKKVIAEGAGASPLAGLLSGRIRLNPGDRVVLVISGGNVDTPLLDRIIRIGLLRTGRLMHYAVTLDDSPGNLARFLSVVGGCGGNVMNIRHSRMDPDLPVKKVRVEVEIETRDKRHIGEIRNALVKAGFSEG